MNPILVTIIMFVSLIALLITGRQLFLILGIVATTCAVALWGSGGIDMVYFQENTLIRWYVLLAFPPFIFMGYVLARSGVADSLYEMIYKFMGGIKGGLAMGTIGICCLLAAIAGTSISGTVAMGIIALPSMLKRKYDKIMVTGVVQAGGALGYLIPPSLVFILYGMMARVSIGQLWVAGIIPGLMLGVMYIIYIGIRCHFQPHLGPAVPREERATWREKIKSIKSGIAPLVLIFLILGLLVMGVTTLMECSAIGAIGALGCAAIYRKLTWQIVLDATKEAWQLTVLIVWIFAGALLFSAIYSGLGASRAVESLFVSLGVTGIMTIVVMMLTWIVLGMVMDDFAMLIIVAPLYLPIVDSMGFSLVWFGVLYVITVQMALLTPPFGFSLFIMKGLVPKDSGITMIDLYKSVIPFVGIQLAALGLLIKFPQLCLWLPTLFFGGVD